MSAAGESTQTGPDASETLRRRIAELEDRLREAEETLEALRTGEVDAVVISGPAGQQVYTLESADRPYRILIEQMQEGAVTLAADGVVLYCNRRFASMLHEAMERVLGAPIQRFILSSERTALERLLADSSRGGARGEFLLQTADGGTVPAQLSFIDLPGGGGEAGRVLCGVITDLTEPRKLEEQLRHAHKIDTIGQLTGSVAHDFNNLLMAVIGNLDLLTKRLSEQPETLRLVDGAMEGAKRGAALTKRLLAFARRQDLRTNSVDLADLLRGMSDLLARSVSPLAQMQMDVKGGLPPARVDANQLELALLNLVLNASDAMPDGGRVTVTLDDATVAEDAKDLAPGAYLRLRVSDTGKGMDAQTLKFAIEPFFSTKELGKGTGLGLPMVHGLAEQLGGALRLSSALGKGTTAELWLPVASTPPRPIEQTAPAGHETAPATILFVDDDALIAMSTVEMLKDLGHTVIEATSGARALEILSNEAAVDLLVTDQAMPGMTGTELALAARELRPELPVLLATGYAHLPHAAAAGIPRLIKPYQQDQLASAIAQVLGSAAKDQAAQ